PGRRGRGAIPAFLRRAVQEGREEGDARGPPPAERGPERGAAGPRVRAGRERLRTAGRRGEAPARCEPGGRPGRAEGQAREVAPVTDRHRRRVALYRVRPLARSVARP